MSRGPGHVQAAIMAALAANPDRAYTTRDLASIAYPQVNRLEGKHFVSVHRVVTKQAVPAGWSRDVSLIPYCLTPWLVPLSPAPMMVVFNTASEASRTHARELVLRLTAYTFSGMTLEERYQDRMNRPV